MTTKTFIEVQAHIPIGSRAIFPAGHEKRQIHTLAPDGHAMIRRTG